MIMNNHESYYQPRLPFEDSTWAEDMLVYEYGKHCHIIGRAILHNESVSEEQVRIAQKMVKNTEWYWLQQIMFRFHGELNLPEMMDQQQFRQRLLNEQGRNPDKVV